MNISKMSYKNQFWKYNPSTVKLLSSREVVEQKIPLANNILQNFGRNARVVTGEGYFFGEDCFLQYDNLWSLHKEEKSGLLTIPKFVVMNCYFLNLEIIGEPKENLIQYKFTFLEDMESNVSEFLPSFYIVQKGDSLWDISNKYNISVAELLSLNLWIKHPFSLAEGDKVILC